MEKIEFRAESKRMLDLMINSIYTNKEIFLRELISNASDAIDKSYYRSLKSEELDFDRDDFYIEIDLDKKNRILTVKDTGIGMNDEDLKENLGVIAKSGSMAFKEENKTDKDLDIIGQFGVGFYSAFMVADKIVVNSRKLGEEKAYSWESTGAEGFTIEEIEKDDYGTEIILYIKDNTEEKKFDEFLQEERLIYIIKKYSDFIRYPIKMEVTKTRQAEDSEEFIEYREMETINSMVPIWRKSRNELTEEDYVNFYHEKHFGFDEPLSHIHFNVDGHMSYRALLYIPRELPYNFYTQDFKKGLELYSSGVLIMDKSEQLLPDYFSFVKGVVDSEDLSLNISREILQNDRQLELIANRIESKIREELEDLLKNEREDYEVFYENFGNQLKYGAYSDYGRHKDKLQDLLLFYSSTEKKLVSFAEYLGRMKDHQEEIYYATGESIDRIDRMPQTERFKDRGFEILYLDGEIDEFVMKMLISYEDKIFKSISSGDIELDDLDNQKRDEIKKENKELFEKMQEILGERVVEVRPSTILKDHPVCLTSKGDISIEMEKVLDNIPENEGIQAEKVLEINTDHLVFEKLQNIIDDENLLDIYTEILYDQARLIEGLSIEDPIKFAENISRIM